MILGICAIVFVTGLVKRDSSLQLGAQLFAFGVGAIYTVGFAIFFCIPVVLSNI